MRSRETPLSHSFCKHVVSSDQTLVIDDARLSDLVSTNAAVTDLKVIAYLGEPVRSGREKHSGHFACSQLLEVAAQQVKGRASSTWTDHTLLLTLDFPTL